MNESQRNLARRFGTFRVSLRCWKGRPISGGNKFSVGQGWSAHQRFSYQAKEVAPCIMSNLPLAPSRTGNLGRRFGPNSRVQ
jgi:hypothetical protein